MVVWKNKFFGIRQDAKARAIEREEMRMQDNLEIYDPDEIPEDMRRILAVS